VIKKKYQGDTHCIFRILIAINTKGDDQKTILIAIKIARVTNQDVALFD